MVDKWEQTVVKHKGAVRSFLHRMWGDKAFNSNGTIKESYLDMAIKDAKEQGNTMWERRFVLARTFKEQARTRE